MSTSKGEVKSEKLIQEGEVEDVHGSELFLAPTFSKLPTNEELEELYQQFCASNGHRKQKVGMTIRQRRYSKFEQMNVITEDRHLCYVTNQENARKIEIAMMEIVEKFDEKGNEKHDFNEGASTEKDVTYIIYLTYPKSDTSQCPMCVNTFIEKQAERIHHMENIHPVQVAELKELRDFFVSINDQVSIAECDEFLNWPASANNDSSSEEEPPRKKLRVIVISSDDSDE